MTPPLFLQSVVMTFPTKQLLSNLCEYQNKPEGGLGHNSVVDAIAYSRLESIVQPQVFGTHS